MASAKKGAAALDEMDILTATQAAQYAHVSLRVVMDALRAGELKGKNYGGRKGWTTTRRAVAEWVEGGNQEK